MIKYRVSLKSIESDKFHYGFVTKKVVVYAKNEHDALFQAEANNQFFTATNAVEIKDCGLDKETR